MKPEEFSGKILAWFDHHGRKDLPWQQEITPYRVWVSEIMLQQTQVTTVIPYFERFMTAFADIKTLAEAPEDQVLHLWTGLGYYARARNLHRTAQTVHHEHNGQFPETLDGLCALPGIGRSTAGAILSIAMGQRAPILDGNVKRVLARFHAIEGWPGQTKTLKALWQHAEEYTPPKRVADYTQAMMDLGAMLCTRTQPDCNHCPLNQNCKAFKTGRTQDFPTPKPRKQLPVKSAYVLILQNQQGQVLLEKRPPSGIWGGLWSLPQAENQEQLLRDMHIRLGADLEATGNGEKRRHTFSHYHFDMQPVFAQLNGKSHCINEPNHWLWYDDQAIGLPAPIKTMLEQAAGNLKVAPIE